jgi:GT2 family glycosyltransferase
MHKVSVVILNWNGVKFLKQFLPNVIANSTIENCEVVVADNGSTDESIKLLKTEFPEVRIIELDKNYGFAGGYNKALEQVNSQYYILLNSDVEVEPNWISPIINYLDNSNNVAACMPKIRDFYNRESFEYAGAAGGYIDKYGYAFCRGRIFDTIEKDLGQYNDIHEIFWATGACLFIKSEAFWSVGGFDAEFFAHMEEIDLCWRLQWKGMKIMYLPNVTVYHVGGGTLPKENPHKTFLNFRNNLYLLYKNLPSDRQKKILFIRMVLDYIAAAKYLLNFKLKHFYAIIRAHLNFYRKITYLRSSRKSMLLNNKHSATFDGCVDYSILIKYFINNKKLFRNLDC